MQGGESGRVHTCVLLNFLSSRPVAQHELKIVEADFSTANRCVRSHTLIRGSQPPGASTAWQTQPMARKGYSCNLHPMWFAIWIVGVLTLGAWSAIRGSASFATTGSCDER